VDNQRCEERGRPSLVLGASHALILSARSARIADHGGHASPDAVIVLQSALPLVYSGQHGVVQRLL
jgi:hypothetical protein